MAGLLTVPQRRTEGLPNRHEPATDLPTLAVPQPTPRKCPIVPPDSLESTILSATHRYLDALSNLNAPPPWTICISVLEVNGYAVYARDSHEVPRRFPEIDICAEPIVIQEIPESLDRQNVARILRPAFDYIWREFGLPGSLNYTRGGIYNNRL